MRRRTPSRSRSESHLLSLAWLGGLGFPALKLPLHGLPYEVCTIFVKTKHLGDALEGAQPEAGHCFLNRLMTAAKSGVKHQIFGAESQDARVLSSK
jgi:hypothetical protein